MERTVRFYLENNESITLKVHNNQTLLSIKNRIIKKKQYTPIDKYNNYVLQYDNTDLYFYNNDNDNNLPFQYILNMLPMLLNKKLEFYFLSYNDINESLIRLNFNQTCRYVCKNISLEICNNNVTTQDNTNTTSKVSNNTNNHILINNLNFLQKDNRTHIKVFKNIFKAAVLIKEAAVNNPITNNSSNTDNNTHNETNNNTTDNDKKKTEKTSHNFIKNITEKFVNNDEYYIGIHLYTLYIWNNEKNYLNHEKPLGYIPLSFIHTTLLKNNNNNEPFYQLKLSESLDEYNKQPYIIIKHINKNYLLDIKHYIDEINYQRFNLILLKITKILKTKSLLNTTEGLFRVSGSQLKVNELYLMYQKGQYLNISWDKYQSHTLSSFMKSVMRYLQQPVISSIYYDEYLKYSKYLSLNKEQQDKDELNNCLNEIKKLLNKKKKKIF